MTIRFALAVLSASLLTAGPASAERRDHFTVRTRVIDECRIVAQDLNFGTFQPPAAKTGQTVLDVQCTPGTSIDVTLGDGSSGNPRRREMQGPVKLEYQLYRDAALQDAIDSSRPAFEVSGRDNVGQVISMRVYGQIPAGQDVPPGEYQDLIQVQVDF